MCEECVCVSVCLCEVCEVCVKCVCLCGEILKTRKPSEATSESLAKVKRVPWGGAYPKPVCLIQFFPLHNKNYCMETLL